MTKVHFTLMIYLLASPSFADQSLLKFEQNSNKPTAFFPHPTEPVDRLISYIYELNHWKLQEETRSIAELETFTYLSYLKSLTEQITLLGLQMHDQLKNKRSIDEQQFSNWHDLIKKFYNSAFSRRLGEQVDEVSRKLYGIISFGNFIDQSKTSLSKPEIREKNDPNLELVLNEFYKEVLSGRISSALTTYDIKMSIANQRLQELFPQEILDQIKILSNTVEKSIQTTGNEITNSILGLRSKGTLESFLSEHQTSYDNLNRQLRIGLMSEKMTPSYAQTITTVYFISEYFVEDAKIAQLFIDFFEDSATRTSFSGIYIDDLQIHDHRPPPLPLLTQNYLIAKLGTYTSNNDELSLISQILINQIRAGFLDKKNLLIINKLFENFSAGNFQHAILLKLNSEVKTKSKLNELDIAIRTLNTAHPAEASMLLELINNLLIDHQHIINNLRSEVKAHLINYLKNKMANSEWPNMIPELRIIQNFQADPLTAFQIINYALNKNSSLSLQVPAIYHTLRGLLMSFDPDKADTAEIQLIIREYFGLIQKINERPGPRSINNDHYRVFYGLARSRAFRNCLISELEQKDFIRRRNALAVIENTFFLESSQASNNQMFYNNLDGKIQYTAHKKMLKLENEDKNLAREFLFSEAITLASTNRFDQIDITLMARLINNEASSSPWISKAALQIQTLLLSDPENFNISFISPTFIDKFYSKSFTMFEDTQHQFVEALLSKLENQETWDNTQRKRLSKIFIALSQNKQFLTPDQIHRMGVLLKVRFPLVAQKIQIEEKSKQSIDELKSSIKNLTRSNDNNLCRSRLLLLMNTQTN